tara:strand:- start:3974 stop:4657 length:684 start_codon:yes stop_codon:yes gene_type:complete
MNEVYFGARERLVIPGDKIENEKGHSAGSGIVKIERDLVATQVGQLMENNGTIYVQAFNSAYMPRSGDLVIGNVTSMKSNIWMLDIGGPFEALLPMSLSPWNVQFGDLEEHMVVGDYALLRVQEIDSQHGVVCTMKGIGLRKISTGVVEYIGSNSIRQFIGTKGTNLQKIKEFSGCRITVADNGRIWIEGEDEGILQVREFCQSLNSNSNFNHSKTDKLLQNRMEEI